MNAGPTLAAARPRDPQGARSERCLFWRGLYTHAAALAPLLMLLRPGFFKIDRELVHGLAKATTSAQFREEINDFILNPVNGSWLRNKAKLRISTRRIERFALLCLGPDAPVALVRDTPRIPGQASDPRRSGRRR